MAIGEDFTRRTRLAYVATRVLDTPFWAVYNMLPVIIYKELHATPFQLAAMIALRPLVSLLSMYWSAAINKRRDRLISNIVLARGLGYVPFFFFPFVNNPWFFILSFGLYIMLAVGIVPAWMELLKLNIPKNNRERVFSYTQAFGYMGGGLLPFALGWLLDGYFQAWRWVFPAAAALALQAYFFQRRILVPPLSAITAASAEESSVPSQQKRLTLLLLAPWKNAWELITRHREFRWFQIGSMIVGSGLMIIQPALPIFLVDALHLSYTELAIALTLSKGIGFGAAAPFWSHWINRMDIFRLSASIAALGCLFPLCLVLAYWHIAWLYFGYLSYGVMQSGNELIWNMSGPLFAKDEEDSSVYTSVNVVAIGLRGCFIPAVGSAICAALGTPIVFLVSTLLCLCATGWLALFQRGEGVARHSNAEL